MRLVLPIFALLAVSLFPATVHANPLTSGSAGGFSGSGTLITTMNGDGSYTITGISGTGVTGLIGVGGFNGNDNQLFPGAGSIVDGSGFSFNDLMGNTGFQINIFSTGTGQYDLYLVDSDGYSVTLPVDLTISSGPSSSFSPFHTFNSGPTTQDFSFSFQSPTVTPEPSSILLLGTGLAAAAGLANRRRRKQA